MEREFHDSLKVPLLHLFDEFCLFLLILSGMQGVFECDEYDYVEIRSTESGFRGLMQSLSATQAYSKRTQLVAEGMCERVDLINKYPNISDEQLENGGPQHSSKHSGRNLGRMNGSTGSKKLSKIELMHRARAARIEGKHSSKRGNSLGKHFKSSKGGMSMLSRNSKRSQILIARKTRTRDLEKVMRSAREDTLKNTVIRRSEARLLVEAACDKEEFSIRTLNSPFYTGEKFVWKSAYAGCVDIAKGCGSNKGNMTGHFHENPTRSKVVTSSLDASDLGVFREVEGDQVGSLLDVWSTMYCFSSRMNIKRAPSPAVLLHAMLCCDHAYIRNTVGINNTINNLRSIVSSSHQSIDKTKKKETSIQFSDLHELLHSILPLDVPLMHQTEAERLLTDLAMAFCSVLMPEFNLWMGVDEAAGILGELRPSVNRLTWKEIARVVLLSTLLQEVKGDTVNTVVSLRGKGHTTAPDNFDKRTLRLSRRRIISNGGGVEQEDAPRSAGAEIDVQITESDYSGFEANGVDYISREKYRAIYGRNSPYSGHGGPISQSLGMSCICKELIIC